MRRSLILLLTLILSVFLSVIFNPTLRAGNSSWQASETPVPAVPISFNETIMGRLGGAGKNSVIYTFDVPVYQDIVIAYEADKVVMDRHCIRITAPSTEPKEDCLIEGGGGGDGPVSRTLVIPATNQPDTRQTVEFWLYRPLEGVVSYQFTAYPVTPQPLAPDQRMNSTPTTTVPYQMYMLEADRTQPFIVQIEDAAADGDFLWTTYQPYLPYLGQQVTLSEDRQLFLQWVDGAQRDDNPDGIMQLYLDYLGGNDFRVFVKSAGDYSVLFKPFQVQSLNENDKLLVTVSYQEPAQAIRLDTTQGDVVSVNVEVVEGTGASVSVYTEHGDLKGDFSLFGPSSVTDTVFPLVGTIEHAVTIDSDVVVIVRIPNEFTRDQAIVSITWQRKP